jgi:hypothetical protein
MVLLKAIGVLAESDPQDYEEATFKVEVELGRWDLEAMIDIREITAVRAEEFFSVRTAVVLREALIEFRTAGKKAMESRIEADKADQKALARLQGRG